MNPYGAYVGETAEAMLASMQRGELRLGVVLEMIEAMERKAEQEDGDPYVWEGFSSALGLERTPWPVLAYVQKRRQFEFVNLRGWRVFMAPGGEGHYLSVEADMWHATGSESDLMSRREVLMIEAKTTDAMPSYGMWKACARIAYVLSIGTGVW